MLSAKLNTGTNTFISQTFYIFPNFLWNRTEGLPQEKYFLLAPKSICFRKSSAIQLGILGFLRKVHSISWLFDRLLYVLELSCEYLSERCIWLYVIIISRTCFRVNLRSIVAWVWRNSLLKIGAINTAQSFGQFD